MSQPEIWERCFESTVRLYREIYLAEPDFRGSGIAALTQLGFRPGFTVEEYEAVLRDSLQRGSFRKLEWFCRDYPANLQRMKHSANGMGGKHPLPPTAKPVCGTCGDRGWVMSQERQPGKAAVGVACPECRKKLSTQERK
jgi:hypothetical protein